MGYRPSPSSLVRRWQQSLVIIHKWKKTQNNCQSPSVWGSMKHLSSWSYNDHENGEESVQNYTGGPYQWSQSSWDHSHQRKTITLYTHYFVKNWNNAAPARSPCLKKTQWTARLKSTNDSEENGWKCCGQMRPKSSSLASTQTRHVWRRKGCCLWPKNTSPPSNMEVETITLWAVVFLAEGTWQLHRIKGMMDRDMYRQGQGIEASQALKMGRGRGYFSMKMEPQTHGQVTK